MTYFLDTAWYILQGCTTTLKLFALTLLFSLPLGFICAMAKTSKIMPLKILMEFYTTIIRGTPLLLQIFFVYYGLPIFISGLRLERFNAAVFTFILNYGAYFTEIFRAGIQSIDRGQYEACRVLGMNYSQTMRRIILPQTIKRVLPPIANEAITLVKDTALVVVLGIGELLRNSKEIVARDFTISPFIIAAIIYLILNYAVVLVFKKKINGRTIKKVVEIVNNSNGIKEAKNEAALYTARALREIERLDESYTKKQLKQLTEKLLMRKY